MWKSSITPADAPTTQADEASAGVVLTFDLRIFHRAGVKAALAT